MSDTISLYDLLGVSGETDPRAAAAALWPSHLVQGSTGVRQQPDDDEAKLLVDLLQGALTFRNVRPGADAERVGVTAEMLVGAAPPSMPLVLASLPDVEFHLLPTSSEPARVTATLGDLGVELLVEALPVEIRLPIGFLQPLEGLSATSINSFVSGHHDTLTVELSSQQSTVIRVHVKIRMTEDGRFVIEPAVPLSVGPCRFLGLPCRAIHDLNLFPAPRMGVGPGEERHYGEQALEWTRHPLAREEDGFGVLTVRTVDLDDSKEPLSDLRSGMGEFEWVLEDLAFPIGDGPFPVPRHFLLGLRRALKPGDDPEGAYNLGGLAIPMKGPAQILPFDYLVIEKLLLRSVPDPDVNATDGDRQFAFLRMALTNDPAGAGHGATIELTDEWTVLAGWRHQPAVKLFKLFGAQFGLLGARVGLSIRRISQDKGLFDSSVLVGDLEVTLGSKDGEKDGVVSLQGESKEPTGVVVHDFGLKFGSFQVGSFWKTGGAKLKAFDLIPLEIEEFGMVTEPTGALYFGFSGSIPLPANADAGKPVSRPDSGSKGKVEDGVGFRFYRLRGKVAGDEAAPFLLLDGVGISLRYGKLGLSGFGVLSEYLMDGHRYKEAGLSVELRLPVAGAEFVLGGMFFYGKVSGPQRNFKYGMAGLQVSPIPIGPITLSNIRLLATWNMTPNLGPVDAGSASAMRMFQWYKSNQQAVALPSNRNLGVGGWKPEEEAYTIAAAAQVSIGTRAVSLAAFFAYRKATSGNGLLAGLEIFLLGSKKPIGFAAVEIDGDRWSVIAGLSVGVANVFGRPVPLLKDVPFLTGTFYHTNRPSTTAIGQLQDTSTWLAVNVGGKIFSLFSIRLFAGICLQIVDLPEGPRVFALRVSLTGGSRLFKVGGLDFYLTLQLTAGVWRTESKVSGFVIFFEGGLNIDVFYVFNWGASVRVECSYLGPDPAYRRLACEAKIHTPWWLPDVTFRWTSKSGDPAIQDMRVVATPVIEAHAKEIGVTESTPLPAISPVVGSAIDPAAVYSIEEVAAAAGVVPADKLAQITPIAVDSAVALHFKSSVDDRLVFGQPTAPGLSADRSNDVACRYELVEFGVRRRPVGGGAWTTLVDSAMSRMETLQGLPPAEVAKRMRQTVRMRWDADFQREGKPDARQLLINSDTPYLFAVLNLLGDETLVANTPGWPCCGSRKKPNWRMLDFRSVAVGARVPRTQMFRESRSTLHWLPLLTPVAGPGQAAGGEPVVARLRSDQTPEGVFARLTFVETAHRVMLHAVWKPFGIERQLVVRAFRGLKLLEERAFPLSQVNPGISLESADGITEITLSLKGPLVSGPANSVGPLEWVRMQFLPLEEDLRQIQDEGRCQNNGEDWGRPGGRFAWLPKHEYEIRFKTRVTVKHEQSGELSRETPQTLVFRTRALPGLNFAERVGQEFEPYVESVYAGPGRPLYRSEPVVLALSERSDIFRAPDPPRPEDPLERKQQVDWVMAVSRVGGAGLPERLSRASADWVVSHRGTAPAPRPRRPVDVDLVTAVKVRRAAALDPLWQRFETVLASPFSCGQPPAPRPSRTIAHQPYDPADPNAVRPLWPASSVLRAAAQIRGGPFVERIPFEPGDETALAVTGGSWKVEDGRIGPTAETGEALSLARFGESNWRQMQIHASVIPMGGGAGVAAEVSADGGSALLFLVEGGRLRIVRRQSGVETEVEGAALAAEAAEPYGLEVLAYDDWWIARVGAVEMRTPRAAVAEGRFALAVRGAGRIGGLRVEPLDLYRFEVVTSRFVDFAAHVSSWDGHLGEAPELVPPTTTLAALLAQTPLADLMRRGADAIARQKAFDQWTAGLGVALRTRVERVAVSGRFAAGRVQFLLVETPEPLPFSEDVTLTLERVEGATRTAVPVQILSDGPELRAIVVPAAELDAGEYETTWKVARDRYRAATVDADSRLTQQATVKFQIG